MAAIRLTQRRVDTIRPRKTVRNVRDAELKGYGVRIMPSGVKRYFIHGQYRGHRIWKVVGDAAVLTEAEARARARSMLAALRDDRDIEAEVSGDALFETVAEEVFSRYGRRWKPRTLVVNGRYLRNQILPFFGGRPIAGITREEVQRWFRSLHATPSAANRSAPILSVIMQQAEAWGYRPDGSNPCKGIRRYRQKRSERFLSPEEYCRLGKVLDRHQARQPFRVAALRLLLLTGCRKSEIITLEWRFYRDGRLYLADSKTGRARSGCAARRGRSSTGCRVRRVLCSLSVAASHRGVGSTHSGYSCAPRRVLRTCACMTPATLSPAWRCRAARRFARWAGCWAMTMRRPR